MNRAQRRGADLERKAARALGTRRVRHRPRYEPAPDAEAFATPCGLRCQPEMKHRKRLPALVVAALEQARRYAVDAVPLAILGAPGAAPLVCLTLADFRKLVGLAPADPAPQGALPLMRGDHG